MEGLKRQREALYSKNHVRRYPEGPDQACLVAEGGLRVVGEILPGRYNILGKEGRALLRAIGEQDFPGLKQAIRVTRAGMELSDPPVVRDCGEAVAAVYNDDVAPMVGYDPIGLIERAMVIMKEREG